MLNDATLKDSIKQAFANNISNITAQQSTELDALATKLSQAISAYVRSMTITYTTGLTAPNGPVNGAFGNTIS